MKTLSEEYTNHLISSLTRKIIKSNIRFDIVVGIANGGLNISVPIAKSLKLPHKSVIIQTRDQHVIDTIDYNPSNKKVLVVDDIIDSGLTFKLFNQHFGKAQFATLCYREYSPKIEFVELLVHEYIVFPWEVENE